MRYDKEMLLDRIRKNCDDREAALPELSESDTEEARETIEHLGTVIENLREGT